MDEAALIAALSEGRIGGAGLDVFDQEPPAADHPFRSLDNVTLTPHLGYATRGRSKPFMAICRTRLRHFAAGQPIRVINAEALAHEKHLPSR